MRTLVVVLGLALAIGCKSKSNGQAAQGSGSAGSGSAGSAAAGSANTGQTGSTEIKLPKLSGTPANKTTKPIDKATTEKLAALEFPGFVKDVRKADDKALDVRHKTTTRPKLGATINAAPCTDCIPLELAKWQAIANALKAQLLPDELRNRPDTVFELGETEVNGQKLIYTYQVGHFFGKDELNQPQGSYSDAYALYFNDGINQIRIVAEYKDDAMSREDMLKVAPREDLEKLARAFFDAFTHAW